MSNYIVAIGGTGARIVQAAIHLAASGLLTDENSQSALEEICILFVEPDKGNGNLSTTSLSIQRYQKCYDLLGTQDIHSRTWMKTAIKPEQQPNIWSLFEDANKRRLKDFFEQFSLSEAKHKYLLDVLFTQAEQNEELDTKGFKGRPAIGAAVMKKIIQDKSSEDSWENLCNEIKRDTNPKVFLCGSVFGGTGASGLPLIAQELRDKKPGLKLDALLVLPYFKFPEPKDKESEIYTRSEELMLRTQAALDYYNQRAKDLFDTSYLLGTPEFIEVSFSDGGEKQKNPPHFLELYAALAMRDSLFGKPRNKGSIVLISRKSPREITWDDIPDDAEVKSKILNTTIFALIWLIIIEPELDFAMKQGSNIPLISRFYTKDELKSPQEKQNIKVISDWCRDYWEWLVNLHTHQSGMDLVKVNAFIKSGKLNQDKDEFQTNILREYNIKTAKIINHLSNYRNRNNNDICTVKLAKALYSQCNII